MDEKRLTHSYLQLDWNVFFYHLKYVDCGRSDLCKSFDLAANEKDNRLGFVAC